MAIIRKILVDTESTQTLTNKTIESASISGVLTPEKLGTGTPDISKFLRGDGSWQTISNSTSNIINVSKIGGDYTTINEALASITDATSTNQYIIKLGVGIFSESTITLKPFVIIVGENYITSVIEASDPNTDLIIGVGNSSIFNCQLKGSTGVGNSLVIFNGGGLFRLSKVRFGAACHFAKVNSINGTSYTLFENCTAEPVTSTSMCFEITDNGVNNTVFALEYFIQNGVGIGESNNFLVAHGTKTLVSLKSITTAKETGVGTAIRVYNGADVHLSSCEIQGFNIGIHSDNLGVGPKLTVTSVNIAKSTTYDLLLEHPDTYGSLNGSFTRSKVSIVPTITNLSLSYNDPEEQGNVVLGKFFMGEQVDDLFDVLPMVAYTSTMGIYTGGIMTKSETTPFTVNISAGGGYHMVATDHHHLEHTVWSDTTITLQAEDKLYVFFNDQGILSTSSTAPNTKYNLILGRVVCNDVDVNYIDRASFVNAHHMTNNIDEFNRHALGAIYVNGSKVTFNTARELAVTAGKYYFSGNVLTPSAAVSPLNFLSYYRSATSQIYEKVASSVVDNMNYDNGGGILTPLTSGYYARHSLYVVVGGGETRYMMVYAQEQYSTLVDVEGGNLPTPPSYFNDGVALIASIIVQQAGNIYSIIDERPMIGHKSSGTSASSTHGNLIGLDSDDHPQYLLGSGVRAMSGSLDMGGNNINNVNTIKNIDIATHSSRHLPNGSDPLATAAPDVTLTLATTNSVGISNSLSRSDHTHAISIDVANSTTTGLLSSTDWIAFNNKFPLSGGTITGATTINSTLNISGITTINNTTDSISTTTGAVVISGGVGIAMKTTVGGDVEFINTVNGVILKSPNGTRYRVTITDDGSLLTTII